MAAGPHGCCPPSPARPPQAPAPHPCLAPPAQPLLRPAPARRRSALARGLCPGCALPTDPPGRCDSPAGVGPERGARKTPVRLQWVQQAGGTRGVLRWSWRKSPRETLLRHSEIRKGEMKEPILAWCRWLLSLGNRQSSCK